jgi:hypothetical protein
MVPGASALPSPQRVYQRDEETGLVPARTGFGDTAKVKYYYDPNQAFKQDLAGTAKVQE